MNRKPLVSVLMPVYNGSLFVREAVESILSQTYPNFELIIINDCSTDSTSEIIERFQLAYPAKVRVVHLSERLGAYGAANIGMRHAKGEFIAPMDSDDVSHRERFTKQIQYLVDNPDTIVVASWAKIIDREGAEIGQKVFPTSHLAIYRSFLTIHPIVHPSCMIRRSLLPSKHKLYSNSYGVNDDYFTLFTLFRYGKFANIPEFLFNYRIHLGNSSLQKLKQKFFNTVRIRVEAIRHLGYRPSFSSVFLFLFQIIWVSLMPEKILLLTYLYVKGIYTPSRLFSLLLLNLDTYFFRIKSYSVARLGIQSAQ